MNEADTKKPMQQIADKIKKSSNILVTVSNNPSVDDLSAALGLTILLNKFDKHATAIFSGAIPPAITFLEPDKVFENNADSLRDFIIALDKEKADHLRYKVEGDVVKIFITPYHTTITSDDLEFSQGDFNVDLVLALGVSSQENLDNALSAHGRILHEVTVATLCAGEQSSRLGSIDWRDETASSLSEMVTALSELLKVDNKPILDKQIASALLTGIVASTDRFSNTRTTSHVMTMAAQLMSAGADQQLIAAKLQESHEIDSLPQDAQTNQLVEVQENVELPPVVNEDETTDVMGSSTLPPENLKIDHSNDAPFVDETPEPPVVQSPVVEELTPVVGPAPLSTIPPEMPETNLINSDNQLPQPEHIGPSSLSSTIAPAYAYIPEPELPPQPEVIESQPVVTPVQNLNFIPPEEAVLTDISSTLPLENKIIPDYNTPVPFPQIEQLPKIEKVEAQVPADIIEPSLGGSLNAVSDEAADNLRKELENEQNKTILSHAYLSDAGNDHNSAINGVGQGDEMKNVDIFAGGPLVSSDNAIKLPMPPEIPDFSSLPPSVQIPPSGVGAPVTAEELGVTPKIELSNDPSRFKIPGQ